MELVRNLPQQYRQDPWVLALADAILGVLEDQSRQSLEIRAQLSLETITWALAIEERAAGIVPPVGATLESRRSVLAARYRSSGKVSIETIQAVADAWRNGEVEVGFAGGGEEQAESGYRGKQGPGCHQGGEVHSGCLDGRVV